MRPTAGVEEGKHRVGGGGGVCMTGRGGGEALACIRPGLSKEKEALTKRMRPQG